MTDVRARLTQPPTSPPPLEPPLEAPVDGPHAVHAQCRFEGCTSVGGGGNSYGGALTILDMSGGGVPNFLCLVRMNRTRFVNCAAGGNGGGLWNSGGAIEMRQISFEGCTAGARPPPRVPPLARRPLASDTPSRARSQVIMAAPCLPSGSKKDGP